MLNARLSVSCETGGTCLTNTIESYKDEYQNSKSEYLGLVANLIKLYGSLVMRFRISIKAKGNFRFYMQFTLIIYCIQ